jgi:hypothetical protein
MDRRAGSLELIFLSVDDSGDQHERLVQAAQLFADRGCLFNAHQKFSQKKGARRRL